jgi:hypothetical protein
VSFFRKKRNHFFSSVGPTTGYRDFFLRGDFFPNKTEADLRVSLVGEKQKPCFLEGNGVWKKTLCARFADVGGFFENRAHKTG